MDENHISEPKTNRCLFLCSLRGRGMQEMRENVSFLHRKEITVSFLVTEFLALIRIF